MTPDDKRKQSVEALQEVLLNSGLMPRGFTGKLTFHLSQGAVTELERKENIKMRG